MADIWQSVLLVLAGIFLLRLSGRKSIAEITLSQTVVMLAIGTIIVQPIVQKSMTKTIIVAAVFIGTMVILEFITLKFNLMEKLIAGKAKIVIQNGEVQVQTLRKLRISVDQLEAMLRTKGITNIDDVKYATLEVNGQLGYELKDDAKPLTVGELKKLLHLYMPDLIGMKPDETKAHPDSDLFSEINHGTKDNPRYLQ